MPIEWNGGIPKYGDADTMATINNKKNNLAIASYNIISYLVLFMKGSVNIS
jgi:hypothetical protein